MRLPASVRIKASRDFLRVRQDGTGHPGRFLVLQVLRDSSLAGFRFGIISPRKVGKAVVRNRIRRRLREIVREHQREIADGTWLVILARWRAPEAEFADLEKDWLRLMKKAGAWRENERAVEP